MADKKVITPDVLKFNTFDTSALAFAAANAAADGFLIDVSDYADHKVALFFQNTNGAATARTATVKKGNGLQGVADLASGNVAAGAIACVVVESGAFKNVTGTLAGNIHVVVDNAEMKMAAVVLP